MSASPCTVFVPFPLFLRESKLQLQCVHWFTEEVSQTGLGPMLTQLGAAWLSAQASTLFWQSQMAVLPELLCSHVI